ncbi:MAG: NAD+ synthase [Actinomycetota bacterium]|nr:NAD+ synthase [Actinomycetota bacterium]
MSVLRVAGAQLPNVVGDLDGNCDRVLDAMQWAQREEADVLVLPELALTGYPLEDLALRSDFVDAAKAALSRLAAASGTVTTIVGTIDTVPPRSSWDTQPRSVANAAALLCDGELRGIYHKVLLPTYGVFDEARTFAAGGEAAAVWRIGRTVAGVCVCEDMWSGDGPPEAQASAGAQVLLVLNASLFHQRKPEGRLALAASVARRNGVPLVYVNCVGGQGELVFDGGSLVVDARGKPCLRAEQFEPTRFCLDLETANARPLDARAKTIHTRMNRERQVTGPPPSARELDELEQIWQALVIGTRDFAHGGGLSTAVLGLSGGIDAAVTAAIASDALGADSVLGVAMPAPGSPARDLMDAQRLAEELRIGFAVVPMVAIMGSLEEGLVPVLEGRPAGEVRHDLLARMRGATLLAISEKLGHLALATGNKTELSIGSATLFGDMAGDFAPIKDCPKTLLYRLARHRNQRGAVIPEEILSKPPSSILRESVDLPPYEVLDSVVERYVELGESLQDIMRSGLDRAVIRGILQLIDDAEGDRRLVPPGVKISERSFGKDRRMPIRNAWRPFSAEEARLAPGKGPGAQAGEAPGLGQPPM